MQRTILLLLMTLSSLMYAASGQAHGKLDAQQLQQQFSNTTQLCRKEKDQSTCTTYFSDNGTIKRRLHKDNKRRVGKWETNSESNQLCITWKGKTRALCFDVYENKDGTMDMYKKGKHLSTVLNFSPGNTEGL